MQIRNVTSLSNITSMSVSNSPESSISLTDVLDNSIVQRDTMTTGTLYLSGTFAGSPEGIQARVVEDGTNTEVIGWTTIETAPSAGVFNAPLSGIPIGEGYNAQVRFSNITAVSSSGSNSFSVGILVGCTGQSQMSSVSGWFVTTSQTEVSNANTKMWNGLAWVTVTGNGAIAFANKINNTTGVPVGLIDSAVNSSGLTVDRGFDYWLNTSEGSIYDNFIGEVDSVGGRLEYILFLQGEADAYEEVSESTYSTGLETFFSNLRSDISSPIGTLKVIIGQLARYTKTLGTDASWSNIRAAQKAGVDNDANAYLGTTSMDLGLRDGVHLTYEDYIVQGERMAQTVLYILGEVSFYKGAEIVEFELINSTTIDVTIIHNSGTDLTPTSSITGFEAFNNGSPVGVSTAVRQSTTVIRLGLSSSITGAATLRYQYGKNTTITGIVKDNSSLAIPLELNNNIAISS